MRPLLDLVLPPACGACGILGARLCQRCLDGFRPASDEAMRFVAADPGIVVGSHLSLAVAAFAYEGPVRRALARLKYAGASSIAEPVAERAAPTLERLAALSGSAVLVPVPIHVERRRQRGYNQAALLARRLGKASHRPVVELLERSAITERQHRLDRAARMRNLRGAISVRPRCAVPAVVIVVDDILTTCATLETCAAVLHAQGGGEVYGFAIAREL